MQLVKLDRCKAGQKLVYGATAFSWSDQQDIPATGFCAADLLVTGSSATVLGWVASCEDPGAAVVAGPAGAESWVERAEAGGALVLTGSSDVVRPLPAASHTEDDFMHNTNQDAVSLIAKICLLARLGELTLRTCNLAYESNHSFGS